MLGETLISWTIRICLVFYAVTLGGDLVLGKRPRWQARARWLWLTACVLFVAHVICAFHFYHHWSHAHAVEDTAKQTEALIGWAFGDGIYFSYLFTVLWVVDALWRAFWTESYLNRRRGLSIGVHAFMFFIAFKGAVIFEGGVTRWLGIPVTLLLGGLLVARLRSPSSTDNDSAKPA